jgi:hypothetical protein
VEETASRSALLAMSGSRLIKQGSYLEMWPQDYGDPDKWSNRIALGLLTFHEMIALHTTGQPQWYPECAQLVVTGSGTATPSSSYLAAIPGVCAMSNPEVSINVYAQPAATTYTIPGPAVWTG